MDKKKAIETIEKVKKDVKFKAHQLDEFVKENPYKVFAYGVALGVLAGLVIWKCKK